MGTQKTRGLVIDEKPIGDSDRILTIFTEAEGKIHAIARGIRHQNSPLAAGGRLFAWSEFIYYPSKNLARIQQANLIEAFYEIGNDPARLAWAGYCADLLDSFYDVYQDDARILKLSVFIYYYMARHAEFLPELLVVIFQMKLLVAGGFSPDLSYLNQDNTEEPVYFVVQNASVSDRRPPDSGYTYRLDAYQKRLFKALREKPIKDILTCYKDDQRREEIEKISALLNHFIEYNLDKKIKAYGVMQDMREMRALTLPRSGEENHDGKV